MTTNTDTPIAGLPPIVAFAHHPWIEPEWMNRQHILSRLGERGWPVAYSAGALDWWNRQSTKWHSSPWRNTAAKHDTVLEIQPGRLGARWRSVPLLDRAAIAKHARFARSTVADPNQRIIAMLFEPQYYPYIEHLQPCDVVFHAYDNFAGQAGWTELKAEQQAALVAEASLVTASSEAIARGLNGHDVRVLPNGADVKAFLDASELPEPSDLRAIPHPRIGYAGAINRKVDLKLIADTASEKTGWQWVLVGRVESDQLTQDAELADDFQRCRALPNVHFLGQKNRTEMPAYIGHMDVNTMCYRVDGDGWWKAVYPLKLHEYLAAGLPVISTPVESVLAFQDVLAIARTAADWISTIEFQLTRDSIELRHGRIATAKENSWDSRVIKLENWLHTIVAQNDS